MVDRVRSRLAGEHSSGLPGAAGRSISITIARERTGQAGLRKRIKDIAETRRFQHCVQRLLDRPPDDGPRCSRTRSSSIRITLLSPVPLLSSSMVAPCIWLRRSSRNANLTRAGATAQICERFLRHHRLGW